MSFAKQLFDLSGKVAIITGASRGLGKAAAIALSEAGANVALVGRDSGTLAPVEKELIEQHSRKALAVQCDVSDHGQVRAMVQEVLTKFGKIDILVNSAGIIVRKEITDVTDEDWNRVIHTNLDGTYYCCTEAGKSMIARGEGGKIINVGSLGSVLGLPDRVSYAASKAGVLSLTRTFAGEWAKFGINVNAIGPGYFRTKLTTRLQEDEIKSRELVARIPMHRWGEPEDLQGTFVFLASHASDYVTGQMIWVDGGFSAI